MPLRAVGEAGDLQAFELDDARWADLKGTYRALNLRMDCCQAPAVPKTSKRGNHFFAHARRGECETAEESAEHLFAKFIVARAAAAAGWTVTTERRGQSPSGETWVADVFCEKGGVQRALEIQLSPQTTDETMRRQSCYEESGVNCTWFMGPKLSKDHPSHQSLPVFSLSSVKAGQEPLCAPFELPLTEFVTALLSKQVIWQKPGHSEPFCIDYLLGTCDRCGKSVNWSLAHTDDGESRSLTPSNVDAALSRLYAAITYPELDTLGLGHIVRVVSSANGLCKDSFENFCPHCETRLSTKKLIERALEAGPKALRRAHFDRNTNGSGCWALVSEYGEYIKHGPWVFSDSRPVRSP